MDKINKKLEKDYNNYINGVDTIKPLKVKKIKYKDQYIKDIEELSILLSWKDDFDFFEKNY